MANNDPAKAARFVPSTIKKLGSLKDDKGKGKGPLSTAKTGSNLTPFKKK